MHQIVSEQFCEVDRHWLVFHYCMFQNAITVLMFSADIYAHVRRLLVAVSTNIHNRVNMNVIFFNISF